MTKSQSKKLKREENYKKLLDLKRRYPELVVIEFTETHWRLIGERAVDYWPTTEKAWVVDTYQKADNIPIHEAVKLAILKQSELYQ